jgi:transcriptional regulator with XRE-family HTH domain
MQKKTKDVTLGQRIRLVRKQRDWSREKLASLSDAHVQSIAAYERDVSIPSALVLKKIADALGVSMEYLVSGESNNTISVKSKELLKRVEQLDRVNPDSLKSLLDIMDVIIREQQMKELARAS